ncbi:MAG: phage Gp37/Gp68 family protein [Bacteroidales bacterium]|nr:phage Gp37/Gp68 family protein [Bacteroidales bacterium]
MNRSAIDWCDYTWNPVTGCRHDCEYCYARKMTRRFSGEVRLNKMAKADYDTVFSADAKGDDLYVLDKPMLNEKGNIIVYPFGFEPTFHRYRLDWLDKLGHGQNIFVGAMADMFGDWVPDQWIYSILQRCECYPQHNYLFLTKNPDRYLDLHIPEKDNFWYGATITTFEELLEKGHLLPQHGRYKIFLSIEPILEDLNGFIPLYFEADWIIVGAETGGRKDKVVPQKEWIDKLSEYCLLKGIPIFMKESLREIMGSDFKQQYPAELKRVHLSKKMKSKIYNQCCICKGTYKKSDMITLLGRTGRGEQPKQYGWMCRRCFKYFCLEHDLDLPDITGLKEE